MSKKEEFSNWLSGQLAQDSGAVSSYLISLEHLSRKYIEHNKIDKNSIFDIVDPNIVYDFYLEAIRIQRDNKSYIFNPSAPSYGERGYFSAALKKYYDFLSNLNIKYNLNKTYEDLDSNEICQSINISGLLFSKLLISRLISSLVSKPFVILTGLSGSGKTKLAQAFVQWICQDENQYRIVPVGADWTNREPLLGYPNSLDQSQYVKPDSGVLDLIIDANNQPELPFFLILDEMNLSHVERYFADFLSVMESKEEIPLHEGQTIKNGVPGKLKLPNNLFIIGTVNIDETTNMFSPKVLDRANTIEFRITEIDMQNFLGNMKEVNMDALIGKGAGMAKSFLDMASSKAVNIPDKEVINIALLKFFGELKKTGAEFGYRSASEIFQLINKLSLIDNSLTLDEKIDIAIVQKLLPKLHGSRRKLTPVLNKLASFCVKETISISPGDLEKQDFNINTKDIIYPISFEKITRMYKGAIDHGFTSFAEA